MLYPTRFELKSASVNVPFSSTGRLMWRRAALHRAYSQSAKWSAAGQWAFAWSNYSCALSERSRIACLAIPFWKWAFTPQKVSFCLLFWHDCWKALSWICLLLQLKCWMRMLWLAEKLLKCSFGGNDLDSNIINLKMNKLQSRVVIQKDGGTPVSLFGECSLQLGKEAQFGL